MELRRIDLTDEQHIRLMLTLLNERHILRKAIKIEYEETGEMPENWLKRLKQINDLIEVIK